MRDLCVICCGQTQMIVVVGVSLLEVLAILLARILQSSLIIQMDSILLHVPTNLWWKATTGARYVAYSSSAWPVTMCLGVSWFWTDFCWSNSEFYSLFWTVILIVTHFWVQWIGHFLIVSIIICADDTLGSHPWYYTSWQCSSSKQVCILSPAVQSKILITPRNPN